MKVRLTVTVELDPAEWAQEYGCPVELVREDVRDYFAGHVMSAAAVEDASLTVRVS